MKIPVGMMNIEDLNLATLRAIQTALWQEKIDLQQSIGNQSIRNWLDAICSYISDQINQLPIPIFKVTSGDNHYKIYENGMIEGFPEDSIIINRIQVKYCTRSAGFLEEQKGWG